MREIAEIWREIYNLPDGLKADIAFDRLFADGDTFRVGNLTTRVMLSPGHTLGSITYVVGADAAFVHDTLMYPDSGSSRADFPGGDAAILYRSIQEILALPDETRLFVGHDYSKDGREPQWEATVAEHKAANIHLKGGVGEADFVKLRTERDSTLALPDRMLHALQVNLGGGRRKILSQDSRQQVLTAATGGFWRVFDISQSGFGPPRSNAQTIRVNPCSDDIDCSVLERNT